MKLHKLQRMETNKILRLLFFHLLCFFPTQCYINENKNENLESTIHQSLVLPVCLHHLKEMLCDRI